MFGLGSQLEQVREAAWATIEACKINTELCFDDQSLNSVASNTVGRLSAHLDYTSRGVDALINVELLECAHILSRSSLEATGKLVFIALQSKGEREATANELIQELSEIYNRRNKIRASNAADFAESFDDPFALRVYKHIAESSDIKASVLSKPVRKKIEQKWAFTTIYSWAEKRFRELNITLPISPLVYHYGMSSHLLHADGVGLDLELDQELRPPKEAELKLLAEGCNLYSNLCCCWLMSALATLVMLEKPTEQIHAPLREFNKFFNLALPFLNNFSESQKEFYSSQEVP